MKFRSTEIHHYTIVLQDGDYVVTTPTEKGLYENELSY